jgi:hypothetical protein
MVLLNLKLERQQWLPPRKLVFIILTIAVLLSTLSLNLAVISSECAFNFVHNDVATLLPLFISSPAVMMASLASQQSYGVFDDIPDQRWELMRKQAHEQHTHVQKDISIMPKIEYNTTPIIEYLSNNVEVRK